MVDRNWVDRSAYVFDLHPDSLRQPEGDLPLRYEIAAGSVAYGDAIIEPHTRRTSDDIALVELAQALRRDALVIAKLDQLVEKQEVAMVGCARMRPLTLVSGAKSETAPRVHSFDDRVVYTNVEAFQGNSGSALLDAYGNVLGVHVGITADDDEDDTDPWNAPDGEDDENVAVAAAVRVRVIGDLLAKVGATILA